MNVVKKTVFLCTFLFGCAMNLQAASAEEIGEVYEGEIEIGYDNYYLTSDDFAGGESYYILCDGNLWRTYPQIEQVRSDVKDYQGGEIITFSDEGYSDVIYQYILDNDGTLWSEDQKLASNIVKFTGNYALDENGTLIDIYYGLDPITNVKDWHDETESDPYNNMFIYTGDVYILKNDQSLWHRKVKIWDGIPEVTVMEQIMDGVAEINATSILCTDGRIYTYTDLETPIAENGAKLTELAYSHNPGWREPLYAYYGTDGNFYVIQPDLKENVYFNLGKMEVRQLADGSRYILSDKTIESGWYILASDGQLLRCDMQGALEKIDSEVEKLNENGSSNTWVYKKKDGFYYNEAGEKMGEDEPLLLKRFYGTNSTYKLVSMAREDDGILLNESQNDQEILDYVVDILGNPRATYAVRKDGTVWDVSNDPVKVLDLTVSQYTKGDIDDNGKVDISDLRLVLRSVCSKITLDNQQISAADVEQDDKVDIKDLRKLLRFVCGKIDEF